MVFSRSLRPNRGHRLATALLAAVLCQTGTASPLGAQDLSSGTAAAAPRSALFLAARDPSGQFPELGWFQTPLQHLGVTARPHGFEDGPPAPGSVPAGQPALLWFAAGAGPVPDWLPAWVLGRVRSGARVVLLGDPDRLFLTEPETGRRLRRALGFEAQTGFVEDPLRIETVLHEPLEGWHESPPRRSPLHRGDRVVDPRHRLWVSTRDRREPQDRRDAVVTGDFGGLARQPFLLEPGSDRLAPRWHLDPLRWLRAALGLEGWPVPDPHTVHGSRVFYWSIGSEGLTGRSAAVPGAISNLDVLTSQLLDRRRLPVTLTIDPAAVLTADASTRDALIAGLHRLAARSFVEIALELPTATAPDFEDGAAGHHPTIDTDLELARARLLLETWTGRPVRLVQWRHAPHPDAAGLRDARVRAARTAGLLAVETRGFRHDVLHPSILAIPPLGRADGVGLLVHQRAPLEALYPRFYTELPGAYRHAAATLTATGAAALRLTASLRPQLHSAEQPARLDALRSLLDTWTARGRTCCVLASAHYAAVHAVLDPERCQVQRRGSTGFRFTGFGSCRTLRFDQPTPRIDWARSPGVVGARRVGDRLWIELGADEAELRWLPAWQDPAPELHLQQADRPLAAVDRAPGRMLCALDPRVGPPGQLVFAGLRPGARVQWLLQPAGTGAELVADAAGCITLGFEAATTADQARTLLLEVLP